MLGFIAGLILGSAFTIMLMSLMIVSKRADNDDVIDIKKYRNQIRYQRYRNQTE